MHINAIDSVFFWVRNLETSTRWYADVLGMEPVARHGGWQVMLTEPVTFALHEGKGPHADVNGVVALKVDDLGAVISSLTPQGIEPIGGVTDTGRARFVTISDPDGNHIQLLERE